MKFGLKRFFGKKEQKDITLYLTYCSALKSNESIDLPAIDRYVSKRIDKVHELSQNTNSPFKILSGKFGLVGPFQLLPNYDFLLKEEMVNKLSLTITEQLNEMDIDQILYFTNSIAKESNVLPYLECLQLAARNSKVALSVVEGEYDD